MKHRLLMLMSPVLVAALALGHVTKANATITTELSADKTVLTISITDGSDYNSLASTVASNKTAETKTIVFNANGDNGVWHTPDFSGLDADGIENLVLHYNTVGTVYQAVSNDMFKSLQHIKRVILPKQTTDGKLNSFSYTEGSSVEVYQVYFEGTEWHGSTQTTVKKLQIKSVKAGGLAHVSNAHYSNADFDGAECIDVSGTLGFNDFKFFSGVKNKRVNLFAATLDKNDTQLADSASKKAAIDSIKNSVIEYLALPDVGTDCADPSFKTIKTNIPNLKGVSYLNDTTFTAKTWTDRGGVAILSYMMDILSKAQNKKISIKSIKISGPINAEDIGGGNTGTNLDKDGHLAFDITESVVNGEKSSDPVKMKTLTSSSSSSNYDHVGGSFYYCGIIQKVDLADAEIDVNYPNDLCLSQMGAGLYANDNDQTKEIVLPNTIKEIPVSAFSGFKFLKKINIPQSCEIIRGSAFQNDNALTQITTVNADTLASMGDSTMVFSSNLKLIETGAFANVEHITDVYCLGNEAPEAQRWAFNTTMTFGNNGFSPSKAITRDNYINGGKHITVLHYPSTCSTDQVKEYTDPTREYSITDGLGTTDGNGWTMYWPNQSEFSRAYEQGHTGYIWKAWDTTRDEYNNGITTGDNPLYFDQSGGDTLYAHNDRPANSTFYTSGTTKDYRGWHEFALCNSYNYQDPTPIYNLSNIKDNDWWTICLPFDLTKANLRKVYGNPNSGTETEDDYPRVCELIEVERNATGKDITLKFGKNLVWNTSETDATVPAADAVIIKAGHPYMIKPKMNDVNNNENPWTPSNHVLKFTEIGTGYVPPTVDEGGIGKILEDTVITGKKVKELIAKKTGTPTESDSYHYRFIGSFSKWYLPQYGYFLGWKNATGLAWFWEMDKAAYVRRWNPYTCVILVTKNEEKLPNFVTSAGVQEVAHWDIGGETPFCADDSFAEESGTAKTNKGYSFIYDFSSNSTVDGINGLKLDFSQADPSSVAPIFNLNGQKVSNNGDKAGLAKGIYIQNGKKFIVK